MKLKHILISAALTAALTIAPARALEYTFPAPGTGEFGKATSSSQSPLNSVSAYGENYVRSLAPPLQTATASLGCSLSETEPQNVDRSKNSALIPPPFGAPASYLPDSGELLTPNLAAARSAAAPTISIGTPVSVPSGTAMGGTVGAVAAPGASSVTVTAPDGSAVTIPAVISENTYRPTAYTEVTSGLYYGDKTLGTLKIPSIDLSVSIYQGTSDTALAKGIGHFEGTSIWDGNACFAGHNRGVNEYFGKLHTLKSGDRITLTTKLGTRTYSVASVQKISETDRSMLDATSDNNLTLITCVKNEPAYRWCVRADKSF